MLISLAIHFEGEVVRLGSKYLKHLTLKLPDYLRYLHRYSLSCPRSSATASYVHFASSLQYHHVYAFPRGQIATIRAMYSLRCALDMLEIR